MMKSINEKMIQNDKAKTDQLSAYKIDHRNKKITTNQGVGIPNSDDSLKAGLRGPTLLEDFILREKITHFDHERIPERVVHARGSAAHGYFQVYKSMSKYTKAKFLSDPNVKTPVFVRFSTVVGSRGSADTVRDVRGFAVKFYTEEGNYDLVGNNIPVFFIQDAIKFPDIVHSIKPEPDREMPQASSAHDTFWDFVVSNPENAHMIMWLMSDRAIPRSYRMMEGFGVNTFKLINAEGQARFVKFHWKPLLGVHSLVWDEAQKIAGKNPDFHRMDLWESIANGNYPEFELGIQIIEPQDEFKFGFDILDPTKIWPEETIPVMKIGKMTLDRNPTNFFCETEQVAFCPANIVPGIDFSNDPLLQGRLFSYLDTQLLRLGGPNFQEIPINRPVVPINNNQRDGFKRMHIDMGIVSYSPNMLQNNEPHLARADEGAFHHHEEKIDGIKIRKRSDSFKDHFSQAVLFFNSLSEPEKRHVIDAFIFEVGKVINVELRENVVKMFNLVDHKLAMELAASLGLTAPEAVKAPVIKPSPALSQANTAKLPDTRKVAVIIEEGFNRKEAVVVLNGLKAKKICFDVVSSKLGKIPSKDNKFLEAGKTFLTTSSVLYDALYIPGGRNSAGLLTNSIDSQCFINDAFRHYKTIAASGEGVDALKSTLVKGVNIAQGKDNSEFVSDKGIVTTRNKNVEGFTNEFINAIAICRHWAR